MSSITFYMLTAIFHFLSVPSQTKLIYVEENLPLQGIASPPGAPWPLPLIWKHEAQQVTLDPSNFSIIANLKGCDIIDAALHRYVELTLIDRKALPDPGLLVLPHLKVSISGSCDDFPRLNQEKTYEHYSLIIKMDNGSAVANLNSETVWGALRGLETFSQLVYIQEPMNFYRFIYCLSCTPKNDITSYKALKKTCFLPKKLKNKVFAKITPRLNLYHFGILASITFAHDNLPYSQPVHFPVYRRSNMYVQLNVCNIPINLSYTVVLGIRTIRYKNNPVHEQGLKDLLTPCYGDGRTPGTPNYPYHAAYENLDPTNNGVYEFMRSFLVDVKTSFKDYIHLGLDEVFLPCWAGSPVVRKFMTENNYTEVREVEQHYVKEILRLAKDTPIQWITWQDPAERGIQMENDSLVQIWKDVSLSPTKMKGWREYVQDLTEKGYKVILSSCWYINFITYGQDWKNFYNCDPTNFVGTPAQKQLVLGGEAAMWGEYVDATNLMPRLWPRASAAAERLWSMPLDQAPTADNAASRLDQHRCRMLRRGIAAQPILNGYCGEWEVPLPDQPMENDTIPILTTTTPTTTTPTTTTPTTTTPTTTPISITPPTLTKLTTSNTPTIQKSNVATPPITTETPNLSSANDNVLNSSAQQSSAETTSTLPSSTQASSIQSNSTQPSITQSTSTQQSSTQQLVPTTTEGDMIEEIDETENNLNPGSDAMVSEAPLSESDSVVSDDSASAAPIETVETLSATVKYIESKVESNDVEEQNNSEIST
ncbi:unnamed protein product, partial [Meganyctiphanes norvegica]